MMRHQATPGYPGLCAHAGARDPQARATQTCDVAWQRTEPTRHLIRGYARGDLRRWSPGPLHVRSGAPPPLLTVGSGPVHRAATQQPRETAMHPTRASRRPAWIVPWLGSVVLVSLAAALAAPRPRPPGWNKHPPVPASARPA